MRKLNLVVLALVGIYLLAASIASGQGDPTGKEKGTNVEQQPMQVAFENEQVRVLKIHSEPHYISPMHDHPVPRIVVYLTEFNAKITASDGATREGRKHAGDVVWRPAERHAVENLNDKPYDTVEIELKCAGANPKGTGPAGN